MTFYCQYTVRIILGIGLTLTLTLTLLFCKMKVGPMQNFRTLSQTRMEVLQETELCALVLNS